MTKHLYTSNVIIKIVIKKNDNYLLLVLMAMSVKRMLVKNRLINYVI